MKAAIAGTVYVGFSSTMLLAQHNEVIAIDSVPEKVTMLSYKKTSIVNTEMEDFLQHKTLNFRATLNKEEAYTGAEYVVIATSTDYDPKSNTFKTRNVEAVINDLNEFKQTADVIVANRPSAELDDVADKVYTRDLFGSD